MALLRMGSGQGGGGWLPTGGNYNSFRLGPRRATCPTASGPQAQEQQEDGGRVSAADACGGNKEDGQWPSQDPQRLHLHSQFWADGEQEPNSWGKATSWYLFRLVRVNLVFYEPGLGQVTP